jgi:hypothetical protein
MSWMIAELEDKVSYLRGVYMLSDNVPKDALARAG